MSVKSVAAIAAGITSVFAAPAGTQGVQTGDAAAILYVATLHSMNANVTGHQATGEARFTVDGNALTISITVTNVPPRIEHWQHFHGFKDNRSASCATPAADKNHDGIIDLIETEPASGTTMVPFNADPAAMKIASNTYPKASASGSYQYHKTVSVKALKEAFAKKFSDQDLDLDRRVVIIHGVPSATKLPASVASLGTIPAQVTLPIACGKIERVAK